MKPMSALYAEFTIDQKLVQLSARLPVRWNHHEVTKPVRPHDHEFTEICLVLNGSGVHVTASENSRIAENCVLIVPPGSIHAFESPKGLKVVNIYYLPEWFLSEVPLNDANDGIIPIFFPSALSSRSVINTIHELRIAPTTTQRILNELNDLGLQETSKASRWTACCFLKVLLLILKDAYHERNSHTFSLNFPSLVWRVFSEIDHVVATGATIDLELLAKNLNVTRDYIGRLFHQHVGSAPMVFYQRRRLQFVCRLLLDSSMHLSQIAYQLGYSDEAHMCRIFRRELLMTPSQYRKRFNNHSKFDGI